MKNESVRGYGINVLAFGCGYLLAGVLLNAWDVWGVDWDRSRSPTPRFEFIEGLIFVGVFGILAVTSYLVGAIVRSRRLTSPDYPSASRAAVFGFGCFVGLWLVALRAPTNRAVAILFIAAVPGCLAYWVGRRRRQASD